MHTLYQREIQDTHEFITIGIPDFGYSTPTKTKGPAMNENEKHPLKTVIKNHSCDICIICNGEGISVTTLQDWRKFYLTYVQRLAIQYPLGTKFTMPAIGYPLGSESKSEILSPMGKELGKDGKLHPPNGHLF